MARKKIEYPQIEKIDVDLVVTPETLEAISRAAFYDNEDYPYIKKTFMALAKK